MINPKKISSKQIKELLDHSAEICVSIQVPLEDLGAVSRDKNRIGLKNALGDARQLLLDRMESDDAVTDLLAPVVELLEEGPFWQRSGTALALYRSADLFRPYRLDLPVEPRVGVSDRFSVLPLLATLDLSSEAYLLRLSEEQARLHRWKDGRLEEETVPDMPESLEAALQIDPEKSLQQHVVTGSAGRAGPVEGVHGHGAGKDVRREYRTEYLQRVNDAISTHLRGETAPLFVASIRANYKMYEKINTYPGLAEVFLEGSYDRVAETRLVEDLREKLDQRRSAQVKEELSALREVEGEGRATGDLAKLLRAAHEGRLNRLFLAWPTALSTGRWDAERFSASIDGAPNPHHHDLVDLAAAETWRQGGEVRVVAISQWTRESPCVGELRWSVGG